VIIECQKTSREIDYDYDYDYEHEHEHEYEYEECAAPYLEVREQDNEKRPPLPGGRTTYRDMAYRPAGPRSNSPILPSFSL
jgi:hypothetical protein